MAICPVCDREVTATDVYATHYNSGLLQCPNSGQPVGEQAAEPVAETPPEQPAKKPRKKAPPKP